MGDQWRKNLPDGWEGKQSEDGWDGEIPMKPIVWSTVAIALSLLIALVLNHWIMLAHESGVETRVSPLAEANMRVELPSPRLQASPEGELDDMLEQQEKHLASYGWLDPMDERVHIPVDRAMELVLAEQKGGLPTPEQALESPVDVEAPSESDATDPGASEAEADAEPHASDDSASEDSASEVDA